jgi:hypothetical protein
VEKNFSYWSEGGSQANLSKTGVPKIEAMIDFWFERVHLMRNSLLYSSTQTTGSYDISLQCYSFAAKPVKTGFLAGKACFSARYTFLDDGHICF